jgi:hypothetical protein
MHRMIRLAVLAVCLLASVSAVGSARAAVRVPFTITEHVDFAPGGVNTFTATGPLCPSGAFVDTLVAAGDAKSPTKGIVVLRTVYTCDDGSGTFNMLKHVFITVTGPDSFVNTGPVQLLGGTGIYADLTGHGVDNGATTGTLGVGRISGWVLQGQGA